MQQFKIGAHLVTNIDATGLTEHHGLYVGDDRVIHLSKNKIVESVTLQAFSDGHRIRVKKRATFPKHAVEFARSKIGSTSYSLVTNNCEHFINDCLEEQKTSNQVSNISHITLQGAARAGLLGEHAATVIKGPLASVTLASTAAKITGEFIGLPDNVNIVIGTPGDLIGKPIESLVSGTTKTLGETYDCLSNGEMIDAGSTLVKGTVKTVAKAVILTPIEVGVTGIKAGVDTIADVWHWLRH
jgi:hypothetical protein